MAFSPEGHLLVCEQEGGVRLIRADGAAPTTFLRVTTTNFHEGGLLGIAFDPGFRTNRYVYVNYTTAQAPYHCRVSRFIAGNDTVLEGK